MFRLAIVAVRGTPLHCIGCYGLAELLNSASIHKIFLRIRVAAVKTVGGAE